MISNRASSRCILSSRHLFNGSSSRMSCCTPFSRLSWPSAAQLRSYAAPPPDRSDDPDYDNVKPTPRPDIQPTNSNPPSQWDRIAAHENPPVSRPTQVFQALAPREGLPPIRIRRVAKNKYWKPTTMMVVMWLVTFYFMYKADEFRDVMR